MLEKKFSDSQIKEIWNKAKPVVGYDSNKYRQDVCGAWIEFDKYGNINSNYGWEVDHINPKDNDGSDNNKNLRPLQWENNRSKSNNYPNWTGKVTSDGNGNIYRNITMSC